jgi:hypothetical protein
MPQEERAVNEETAPHGADRVPTLTEVVELHAMPPRGGPASGAEEMPPLAETVPAAPLPDAAWGYAPNAPAPGPAPAPTLNEPSPIDTQALVTEVLAELQPRLDMLFEARLREALAPALARAAEGLIREARGELGSALHGLVNDAVKRALLRRTGGR